MRRRFGLPALVLAFAIVLPPSSAAHAGLRLSDPLEGVALGDSPTVVRLSFSEAPEPSLSSVRVVDPNGGAHHVGLARRAPDDPLSLLIDVRPLERGVYIVSWRTVSAVDGHTSAEVGRRLGLSPKSVDTYRSRLMAKLGMEDLPSLVKFALRHGLTTRR